MAEKASGTAGMAGAIPRRTAAALIIVALFAGLIGVKVAVDRREAVPSASATSVTAPGNDPVADLMRAQESGKPYYVLFHSTTCQPCVEISENVDRVMPSFADDVVFVNVITEDERAKPLLDRFRFAYIPTSFFVAADGSIAETYTGPLSEAELRTRLAALAGQ